MFRTPEAFFTGMKKKTVAFVGIGVTNTETIKLFARQGVRTIACDKRDEKAFDRNLLEDLKKLHVILRLGEGYLNGLEADVLFRTPGMYFFDPAIRKMREMGGIVTSELEVFFDLCPCPIIGITGSDGKSTTSTLIAEMLKEEGYRVHLGGNIGKAILPDIFDIHPDDIAVVELSSFQLISMRNSPQIAVMTNVTTNHLDVHGTMEEYINAKRNIYQHQNAFSRTVLNLDNDITASFVPEVRGRTSTFSLKEPVYNGAYLNNKELLVLSKLGVETVLFEKSKIRIPGIHNVANYLAAISAVGHLVSPKAIQKVAENFGGVEHRIEFVREREGVRWFNDSIATSPARVIAGLRSFKDKIILIAGGYDKKLPFEPMIPDLVEHVKLVILTGTTAQKIESAILGFEGYKGSPAILHADSLEQAVALANEHATKGDVVSLSPACASFDHYPNFEARGSHFKDLVNNL